MADAAVTRAALRTFAAHWAPAEEPARSAAMRIGSWDHDHSAEGLAMHLGDAGFEVQVVEIDPERAQLPPAALVQHRDGSWRSADDAGRPGWTGLAIVGLPPAAHGRHLLALIRAALRPHRGLLALTSLTVLIGIGLSLVPAWLIGQVIDRALRVGSATWLDVLSAGALASALLLAWVGWLRALMIRRLEAHLDLALARGLLHHVLRLPFPVLHGKTVGELLLAFDALELLRGWLTRSLPIALVDVGSLVAFGLSATLALPATGALLLLATGLWVAVLVPCARRQRRLRSREIAARARASSTLVELIRGVPSIRGQAAEAAALTLWQRHARSDLTWAFARLRVGAVADALRYLLTTGLPLAALASGVAALERGTATVGTVVTTLALVGGFTAALNQLGAGLLEAYAAGPDLDRAQTLLAEAPLPNRRGPSRHRDDGPVAITGAWFRYGPDQPWILRDLDLRIEPGERVRLIGASGSGKTTLLRLIAGLYEPSRGTVTVAGTAPRDGELSMLYLPQMLEPMGGSLLDNLRWLSGQAPRDRLITCSEQSGLAAWVATLPMGFETPIPPGGGSLSGGQRQLLALTAAAASDASLILLDEPFSNLDIIAARRAWAMPSLAGRTIVYASHDTMQSSPWEGDTRVVAMSLDQRPAACPRGGRGHGS